MASKRGRNKRFTLRTVMNEYLQETCLVESMPGVYVQIPRYRAMCEMLYHESIVNKNIQAATLLMKEITTDQVEESLPQLEQDKHPIIDAVKELKLLMTNNEKDKPKVVDATEIKVIFNEGEKHE